MTNGSSLTPEQNAQDIAALREVVNVLVSEFIRPNAQQHLESMARMERIEKAVDRHSTAISQIDLKLDRFIDALEETRAIVAENAQNSAKNDKQIERLGTKLEQYDERLEETRQLVAKNSSDIAQTATRIEASIDKLVEENRAFRETAQTQLTAIIGNARRIDRLEQQAS
ncbi:MAG: hypothetical protein AB8B99_11610 [Phormidesmis sp.]